MLFPTRLARFISFLLAVFIPPLSVFFGIVGKITVRDPEGEMRAIREKSGFIAGVCHPRPEYDRIKTANIGWIRQDIPLPFDENGNVTRSYQNVKENLRKYVENGIQVMAVTPNPYSYLAAGLDIRNEEDIPQIQQIARFYVQDLRDIVGLFQVCNEMGVDRFTKPFTLDEAAKFIGVQLEAMYPLRGNIRIGYNLGGLGILQLPKLMKPYNQYADYVGADLYFGSFENVVKSLDTYTAVLKAIHAVTRKPLILAEFGYIGCGEPKTDEEKQRILEQYGVHSEEEARENIDAFIEKLPEPLHDEFEEYYADLSAKEKADLLFKGEFAHHLYRELSEGVSLRGYAHTPDGQAKFFADLIPKLKALDFLMGTFVYMWDDSEFCYICGQADCPIETGWGIVDGQGVEKPAYYAVQKAFAD